MFSWKKAIHVTTKLCILTKDIEIVGSWGFVPDPTEELKTFPKTPEVGLDRNVFRFHFQKRPESATGKR